MQKISLFTSLVMLAPATALAGGQAGSLGVGVEAEVSGLGGPSVTYDAGKFHVGGFLGLDDPPGASNTFFEIGARFFYHVHSTAMSDFGLGGSFGLASVPVGGMGMNNTRNTDVFLEPGFQIRLFLASNVALSFSGALVIGVVDASDVAIAGQQVGTSFNAIGGFGVTGGAGVHYYFF